MTYNSVNAGMRCLPNYWKFRQWRGTQKFHTSPLFIFSLIEVLYRKRNRVWISQSWSSWGPARGPSDLTFQIMGTKSKMNLNCKFSLYHFITLYHPLLKANHNCGIPYWYRAKPLKFWHHLLTVAWKLHWLIQRITGSGSASVRALRGYQQIAVVILRRVHPGEVGLQCVRALWFGCQGWLPQSLSLLFSRIPPKWISVKPEAV